MKKQPVKKKRPAKFKRSPCPIANSLDILGDKWTLLVVRDLFLDKHTYGEFQDSQEGIPSNILADRLKRLEWAGIIGKSPYQDRPVRYAYHLTEKGQSLGPIVKEYINWGLKQILGNDSMTAEEFIEQTKKSVAR